MKAIKRISIYILSLALLLLLYACADTDVVDVLGTSLQQEGRAGVTLYVTTPESFSTRTRAISEDNESVLEDKFAVFAFTEVNGEVDTLMFAVKSGDVNTKSNLNSENTYTSDYGNYTTSPSIAWHEDDSGVGGRLYIEYDETSSPVHLLVLANVDLEKVAALIEGSDAYITSGMTFEAVTEALSSLDFDVTDESLSSIPMAGECDLENGFTLGSTSSISLRRSVAKFTVRVEYTPDLLEYLGSIDNVPFTPKDVQILNVNSYATVYSPKTDGTPNISTSEENEKVSPTYNFKADWDYDEASDTYYNEIVFYVAETVNSRQPAYNGDVENTEDPRISVLLNGQYVHETDGTVMDDCYYRLDLIPDAATTNDSEVEYILRNHHYSLILSDIYSRPGSTTIEEVLQNTQADNEPLLGRTGNYIIIEDEDIISITVAINNYNSETSIPYYVGVSSTNMELDYSQSTSACVKVKVVTNCEYETDTGADTGAETTTSTWRIDYFSIPKTETGEYAISFVWDESSETLWLWLDSPDDVEVGETYTFYIIAGNIRKKMNITIIDSSISADSTDEPDTQEEPDTEEP